MTRTKMIDILQPKIDSISSFHPFGREGDNISEMRCAHNRAPVCVFETASSPTDAGGHPAGKTNVICYFCIPKFVFHNPHSPVHSLSCPSSHERPTTREHTLPVSAPVFLRYCYLLLRWRTLHAHSYTDNIMGIFLSWCKFSFVEDALLRAV